MNGGEAFLSIILGSAQYAILLRCSCYHTLVLPRLDGLQCALEMTLRHLNRGGFLVCLEIRVNELNETIEVFRSHLY
jgi:hypothetical protein